MSKINIQLTGIAAELVLGNYMPKDSTIFNDWMEFYHFNDIIHETQLLTDYISEIEIKQDDALVYKGRIPEKKFLPLKSFSPAMVQQALYLRTECAENAIYSCEIEIENFDKNKLLFETQDYDLLFKVGKSFISRILYDHSPLELEWVSAHPVGDLCLLCRYVNGYLVPVYDAVNNVGLI